MYTLLNKADFLYIANNKKFRADLYKDIDQLKKMKVNDLRKLFNLTHLKDGQYKNMNGYCFKCFTPLKPDYIKYENYCLDC